MSAPGADSPRRVGPYTLLAKLGEGGMGVVWRAQDPRLDREVALKLLPEALRGDPDRRARFLREARAVAQLSHPHITAIHEVGEADGLDFIAFEYVDGRTLTEILAARRLTPDEIVGAALPLADAIAYAHERGIVHRDLKPGNVMVTSRGHPKLLDFGLAKRLELGSDAPATRSTRLTAEGAVFGTPGAMSPEQALGREVDARSDVFSFGSLLHELATGRPAFTGATAMEVIDAVIHREPPPLAAVRPDLPPDYGAIVAKAMRKEPGERYQTMADVAADLRHLERRADSRLAPTGRTISRAAQFVTGIVFVAVAAVLAWLFLLDRGARAPTSAAGPGHVAVLYFENRIDPSDADQLGDMLTHLLTTELARESGLSVLSQQRLGETARRTGHTSGRVEPGAASEIAAAAGVTTMVLGRVSKVGGQLVASASVVDTTTGRELATGRTTAAGADEVFRMAEELGVELRQVLRAGGAVAPGASDAERVTTSVDAYREFLSGFKDMQRIAIPEANAHFAKATEIDPSFAQAYYWDAIASAWSGDLVRQLRSIERANAFRERLPPDELRLLPAAFLYHRGQWLEARGVLEEFVAANPENRDAWYMLAELYLHSPINTDATLAARGFETVYAIDPHFTIVHGHLFHSWFLAGDRRKADEWRARVFSSGARDPLGGELLVAAWGEDLDRMAQEARLDPPDGDDQDRLRQYRHLLASNGAIARGDWSDPTIAVLRGMIADGGARLRDAPGPFLLYPVAFAHQMLVLEGSFEEARALESLLPAPSTYQDQDGFEVGLMADACLAFAHRREITGELDEALAIVERVSAAVKVPRVRWQGVVLALRLGRADIARAHLDALEKLVAGGALRAGYYRELARAEFDIVEGRAAQARSAFEAALAPDRVLVDSMAHATPPIGRILDGLWRAERAAGQRADELELLRSIVARPMLRAWDPSVWLRAQAELGRRELESGEVAEGRAHLQAFLAAWGKSGRQLPDVEQARAALAAAEGR